MKMKYYILYGLLGSLAGAHAATLKVDFSDSVGDVAVGYGGFVFANNTAPGTRNYTSGSAGYVGPSIDLGSGIDVTYKSSAATNFRMIDRGGDLFLKDFASIDGALNDDQDLVFGGLAAVTGSFTFSLEDLSNQFGVVDVQLSINGGASFTNVLDDVTYGSTGNQAVVPFTSNGTDDVVVRFWVGGNEFGNTGGTTDSVRRNRIMSLNGFTLDATVVPEPSSSAFMGLAGLALLMRRRR
ncbi:PEP-CTERM sorting domain-containing protein [Oceaniferula marina]|nr:PEP-CTERM sorting domain-containing protein [Oceaniferula marina]